MKSKRVLILGAGVAGLTCAGRLLKAGHTVTVLDKARGPGGRLSTRRETVEGPEAGEFRFDHGAQFLTARAPEFAAEVAAWVAAGVVAPWVARFATLSDGVVTAFEPEAVRYVGTPGMSAICRHLAVGLDIRYLLRAAAIERRFSGDTAWRVRCESEAKPASDPGPLGFDADVVVVAIPDAQARTLVAPHSAELPFPATQTSPCWALMLGFPRPPAHCLSHPVNLPFDGARITNSPLAWAARESSKPGRPSAEGWVLHASPEWSQANLELTPDQVALLLFAAFERSTGQSFPIPLISKAHRWRYAQTSTPAGAPCLTNADATLILTGDYLLGNKIEAACLSGLAASSRI